MTFWLFNPVEPRGEGVRRSGGLPSDVGLPTCGCDALPSAYVISVPWLAGTPNGANGQILVRRIRWPVSEVTMQSELLQGNRCSYWSRDRSESPFSEEVRWILTWGFEGVDVWCVLNVISTGSVGVATHVWDRWELRAPRQPVLDPETGLPLLDEQGNIILEAVGERITGRSDVLRTRGFSHVPDNPDNLLPPIGVTPYYGQTIIQEL